MPEAPFSSGLSGATRSLWVDGQGPRPVATVSSSNTWATAIYSGIAALQAALCWLRACPFLLNPHSGPTLWTQVLSLPGAEPWFTDHSMDEALATAQPESLGTFATQLELDPRAIRGGLDALLAASEHLPTDVVG